MTDKTAQGKSGAKEMSQEDLQKAQGGFVHIHRGASNPTTSMESTATSVKNGQPMGVLRGGAGNDV